MAKEIILAETMGFCWGVRRTLEMVEETASRSSPIAMIGDVIHNPQAVDQLRELGVSSVANLDEAARAGYSRVGITAHGAGPERAERAQTMGMEVIDTTCPLVTRAQRVGQKLVKQGYFLLIYGDPNHPEANGLYGWAQTSRALVSMHLNDLPWQPRRSPDEEKTEQTPPRKVAILSQTTKNSDDFLKFAHGVLDLVAPYGGEVRICNTICEPTERRQYALRELAEKVDAIIVVGGKKSSNTTRLAEIGESLGVPSHHIERPEEIPSTWLEGVNRIGVTAGASTPDEVIVSVIHELQDRGYQWNESSIQALSTQKVPAF